MFLYSFLAGSITKKGLFILSNIIFTVFVFPIPVIPHTKVCLLISDSLKENSIFSSTLSYSHIFPIL